MEARLARLDHRRDPFVASARAPAEARRAHGPFRRQAAPAHAGDPVRDLRHRLVHGLSFPRSEPLRADRQSADADDHRILRRARRALGDRALSARARRAGLALCRPRHQVHSLGRALHRRRAGLDAACARLRALRAALPEPCGDERHSVAQLDVSRDRDSLRRARPRRRAPRPALRRHRRAFGRSRRGARRGRAAEVVGKRFNAFAAEQWLAADGDDRDPASARDPDARCDRPAASPRCRRAGC